MKHPTVPGMQRGGERGNPPKHRGAHGSPGLGPSTAAAHLEVIRSRAAPPVLMQHPKRGGGSPRVGGSLRSCCSPGANRCALSKHRPGNRWGKPAGTAGSSGSPSPPSPAAAVGTGAALSPTTLQGRASTPIIPHPHHPPSPSSLIPITPHPHHPLSPSPPAPPPSHGTGWGPTGQTKACCRFGGP